MDPKPSPPHDPAAAHPLMRPADHADEPPLGYEAALPFLVPGIAPETDSAASQRPTPRHWPV